MIGHIYNIPQVICVHTSNYLDVYDIMRAKREIAALGFVP